MAVRKTTKATSTRKTATQKKVEAISDRLKPVNLTVVELNGKYAIKPTGRGRLKPIVEGMTIAGLEQWANDKIRGYGTEPAEVEPAEVETAVEATESAEAEVENWEIGKGVAPIGDKRATSAARFYNGKNLYLVEAIYSPDTWAVYVDRANIGGIVSGFNAAASKAVEICDQLVAAEVDGDEELIRQIYSSLPSLSESKKKSNIKPAVEAEEVEVLLPSENPNTDPRVAATLDRIFNLPRVAELVGNAATPNSLVNQVLSQLEVLQKEESLTLPILAESLGMQDVPKGRLALFLAQNGVEISFLSDEKVCLTTLAAPESA